MTLRVSRWASGQDMCSNGAGIGESLRNGRIFGLHEESD